MAAATRTEAISVTAGGTGARGQSSTWSRPASRADHHLGHARIEPVGLEHPGERDPGGVGMAAQWGVSRALHHLDELVGAGALGGRKGPQRAATGVAGEDHRDVAAQGTSGPVHPALPLGSPDQLLRPDHHDGVDVTVIEGTGILREAPARERRLVLAMAAGHRVTGVRQLEGGAAGRSRLSFHQQHPHDVTPGDKPDASGGSRAPIHRSSVQRGPKEQTGTRAPDQSPAR